MDLTCRDEVRAAAVNANVASESPMIQLRYDPFVQKATSAIRAYSSYCRATHSLPHSHCCCCRTGTVCGESAGAVAARVFFPRKKLFAKGNKPIEAGRSQLDCIESSVA